MTGSTIAFIVTAVLLVLAAGARELFLFIRRRAERLLNQRLITQQIEQEIRRWALKEKQAVYHENRERFRVEHLRRYLDVLRLSAVTRDELVRAGVSEQELLNAINHAITSVQHRSTYDDSGPLLLTNDQRPTDVGNNHGFIFVCISAVTTVILLGCLVAILNYVDMAATP